MPTAPPAQAVSTAPAKPAEWSPSLLKDLISKFISSAQSYTPPSRDAMKAMVDMRLTNENVLPVVEPMFTQLGFQLADRIAKDRRYAKFECKYSVASAAGRDLIVLHLPDWLLDVPMTQENLDAVSKLVHYEFQGLPVVIVSKGGDTMAPTIELTIESWAEGLSGKLVFVPWKHIDPDGKNAANRLGDFQDHLERVPKPPKPAGPGQGLPPADVDQLVRIMSAAAQNYPGRAPSYFSNLLLKARLPEQFRPEVAGVGQGAPDADARFLIAWAQGKGTAPGTDPPRYTLVLILEALSASLGTEDRSFIVEAIRRIG